MKYLDLFNELAPLPRHINSPSFDYSLEKLSNAYDLEIYIYGSDKNHNGWVVPSKYSVRNAWIKHKGKKIYDGMSHPLSVISYSKSFEGFVDKETLLSHCHWDARSPSWIPYHFRQSYRPWDRDWGFCVTKNFVDSLVEGDYEILIDVDEGEPELKLAKGVVSGSSNLNFALCAHLDHPGMFNDDFAGVVVVLEAFERLKKLKLSYGLEVFIVPEIIGPQFHFQEEEPPFEGLFVESVGNDAPFVLQSSYSGSSIVQDNVTYLLTQYSGARIVPFREVYANDEISFESYGCPMPSLTRGVFEGYHSDRDDMAIISPDRLEEAIEFVVSVFSRLQDEIIVEKNFEGLVSCANPQYDLYIDPGQAAFGSSSESKSLRKIMDYMSMMSRAESLLSVSEKCGADVDDAFLYLSKWEEKGLVTIHGRKS